MNWKIPKYFGIFSMLLGYVIVQNSYISIYRDILMALPQGISIADISVIHPLSLNTISRAATTAGAAASHRDQQKRTAYA
jgi:multisubunit Na+/H+ antiporter MnhG subunit